MTSDAIEVLRNEIRHLSADELAAVLRGAGPVETREMAGGVVKIIVRKKPARDTTRCRRRKVIVGKDEYPEL